MIATGVLDHYYEDHYKMGNGENTLANLKKQIDTNLESFINDCADTVTTRMIIRTVINVASRERIRNYIDKKLSAMVESGKIDEKAKTYIMSRINIIEVDIGGNTDHLNTVIDLFVDIAAMEIDRYEKGDYIKDQSSVYLKDLKKSFLSLLEISVSNFDKLLDPSSEDAAIAVLHALFNGPALKITALNWNSLRDLKRRRDEIIRSL